MSTETVQTPCRHPLPRRHRERGKNGRFGRLTCIDCNKVLQERPADFVPMPMPAIVKELLDGAVQS